MRGIIAYWLISVFLRCRARLPGCHQNTYLQRRLIGTKGRGHRAAHKGDVLKETGFGDQSITQARHSLSELARVRKWPTKYGTNGTHTASKALRTCVASGPAGIVGELSIRVPSLLTAVAMLLKPVMMGSQTLASEKYERQR